MKKIFRFLNKIYLSIDLISKYISNKKYSTISGSISFFFILSIVPFIFVTIICLRAFSIDNAIFEQKILPENINEILQYIVNIQIPHITSYSIFLILTSFYTASNILYQIMQCGELIYDKKRKINFYKKKFITIIGVLVVIILLILTIFLNLINDNYITKVASGAFIVLLKYILIIFFPMSMIIFVNLLVAPFKLKIKDVLIGSGFTLIFWIVSSIGFNIYFTYFSNIAVFYGALTLIIVAFMYIHTLSLGLVIGFILNHKYLTYKKII